MDRKSADELQKHMLGTYFDLRVGLAVIGIVLPLIVLFAGSVLHHFGWSPRSASTTTPKVSLSLRRETSSSGASSPPGLAFTSTRASALKRMWR